MKKHLTAVSSLIFLICILLLSFALRACDSCHLVHSSMYIPPWVNYPIKFRHIKGWIYKFSCPEDWPWSQNRKTIIGFAIIDRDEQFVMDWHIFEIVGGIIKQKVNWEDFERFNVELIERGDRNSRHPYDKNLVKKGPRIILKLIFIYDNNENKFKLYRTQKGLNNTVRKIEKFPTNWHVSFKGAEDRPHLLER